MTIVWQHCIVVNRNPVSCIMHQNTLNILPSRILRTIDIARNIYIYIHTYCATHRSRCYHKITLLSDGDVVVLIRSIRRSVQNACI